MPLLKTPQIDIWYERKGSGPDIVWVPGGDNTSSDWEIQMNALSDDFRNTALDPRGAGRTVCRAETPWTIADMAADTAALIREVCEPPVVLVGLSMGSLITLQTAIDAPELLVAAIAMGTTAKPTGWCRDWMIAEVEARKQGLRLPQDFAIFHYAAFGYAPDAMDDDETWNRLKAGIERSYGERDSEMLIAQWQACIDFDVEDALRDCRVPIHAVGFSHDIQAPPHLAKRTAELAAHGQFHLLEGLGHLSLQGHRPEPVNALVREIASNAFANT